MKREELAQVGSFFANGERLTLRIPGPVARLVERWQLRPVKNLRLHGFLHVIAPAAIVGAIAVMSGLYFFPLVAAVVAPSLPPWLNLVAVIPYAACVIAAHWAWVQKRACIYECFHADLLGATDNGEDGSGWRTVRYVFAISQGHGRVARRRMEWVDVAYNFSEELPVKFVQRSDPIADRAFNEFTLPVGHG